MKPPSVPKPSSAFPLPPSAPPGPVSAPAASSRPADAAVREEEAAVWALRREEGLDAEGDRALATWLAGDPQAPAALARAEALNALFQRARQGGVADSVATALQGRAAQRLRRRRRLLVAAVAVVGLGLTWAAGWWRFEATPPPAAVLAAAESVATPPPVRRLPDGSLVEYRAGAEVRVDFTDGVRRLHLVRGEAHFQVMPDAARPFVVVVNGVEVRAVGTAFSVQPQPTAIEVVVTEGKVEVARPLTAANPLPSAAEPAAPTTWRWPAALETVAAVGAGQSAVVPVSAHAGASARISQLSDSQLEARLAWRQTRLEFSGEELASAVARINRLSRVQIVLGDASLARQRVSGTFQADQPESFARILAGAFDLELRPEAGARLVLRPRAAVK